MALQNAQFMPRQHYLKAYANEIQIYDPEFDVYFVNTP